MMDPIDYVCEGMTVYIARGSHLKPLTAWKAHRGGRLKWTSL